MGSPGAGHHRRVDCCDTSNWLFATEAAHSDARGPISSAPEAIWSAIADYSKFPAWRKSVTRVEALPSANGKPSWREFDKHDHAIPYEIVESMPPQHLVTLIADPNLPFGGTWTYELTPQANGTTVLRITENGEVRNLFFRFVSRFFMGYTKTMEDYLDALGQKFGEKTTVEN